MNIEIQDTNIQENEVNKHRIRRGISLLMAFLLSLSIAFLMSAIVGGITVLPKSSLMGVLERSGYYELARKDIGTNIGYRGTPFGVKEETLMGLIGRGQLEKDVNFYVEKTLKGKDGSIEPVFLETELSSRLEAYLKQEGIPLGPEQKEAISEFTLIAKEEYRKGAEVPFLTVYKEIRDVGIKVMPFALIGLLIVSVFLSVFIGRINERKDGRGYLSYSLAGGGLMVVVLPLIILVQGTYRRIQLAPEYVYRMIMELIKTFLFSMVVAGLIVIVSSVLMEFVFPRIRVGRNMKGNQAQLAQQPQQTNPERPVEVTRAGRRSARYN